MLHQDLEVFEAKEAMIGSTEFARNLTQLKDGEMWGWHSGPIGKGSASSTLSRHKSISYAIENIYDLDLNTAWVEGSEGYGIGELISFTLNDVENNDPYKFYGVIEIFNGYCKSEKIWKDNSRVKSLKILLNDLPIGVINLKDTWQYQKVDISCLFNENLKNRESSSVYDLTNGDTLSFEIVDVYRGDRYDDVAISEFVFSSSPN